ncbi:uncharacterized protein EMH_0086250 [Eimeria mitis]|uniref:Uncharacterized protein n=1 Tax=Eimeria mitis TaxID=44415 RepID=U6K7C9_9EIME|nr:uncharacterized protein EMH_0086250 [Eimeria mitis]CDJ33900.1 hypothetical protein EMH_0086250 [Eimeria mitis]
MNSLTVVAELPQQTVWRSQLYNHSNTEQRDCSPEATGYPVPYMNGRIVDATKRLAYPVPYMNGRIVDATKRLTQTIAESLLPPYNYCAADTLRNLLSAVGSQV